MCLMEVLGVVGTLGPAANMVWRVKVRVGVGINFFRFLFFVHSVFFSGPAESLEEESLGVSGASSGSSWDVGSSSKYGLACEGKSWGGYPFLNFFL